MRTGSKLGLGDQASTSKGTEAKAGSRKVTAPEAAGTKPCSQSVAAKQEEKGDSKGAAASSASAREWPVLKIENPANARYAERRHVAYLLRKVELQLPTKKELRKESQFSP